MMDRVSSWHGARCALFVVVTVALAGCAGDRLNAELGRAITFGQVTSLGDPRFSRGNAKKGLWHPLDFLWEAKPGIYFLGAYRPEKTPVLFVHGINGTPVDFAYLIEHMDHNRYQPWVFYYPSGARLDTVGFYLDQMVRRLKARHPVRKLFVVAHSMGGLVARSFILQHAETRWDHLVSVFVSIASPWDGHPAAWWGVDYAPRPISVWYDMAPGSEFLTRLFYRNVNEKSERRMLPVDSAYHLIFGFLPTESDDGAISLSSQLRWEAQEEAVHCYGVSESHVNILKSPRTSKLLNRILANSEFNSP